MDGRKQTPLLCQNSADLKGDKCARRRRREILTRSKSPSPTPTSLDLAAPPPRRAPFCTPTLREATIVAAFRSMAPTHTSLRLQVSERLMLIPADTKSSTTGYKNVSFNRSREKFEVYARDGGKRVRLGYFDTAEEAATAYARSEYGRADAAKLLQPRAAPTAAGAEVIRQAEREGLTLVTSSSSNSGYKGVTYHAKAQGRKKYSLMVTAGGKQVTLGWFATAEQAALFYARREAGRDTSDLTAPPPPPPPPAPSSAAGAEAVRQAEREGLTLATSGNSTGYKCVFFSRQCKEVQSGGEGWRQGCPPRLLRHRRRGGHRLRSVRVRPRRRRKAAAASRCSHCRWRRSDTAGGEGGLVAHHQQQQQQRLQRRGLLPEQQEVPVERDGWQESLPRPLRHRRAGCALHARREAGRDTSDLTAPPPPPPPPPAPSSAAGAAAVRQAGREGLTLAMSSGSNSGYRGVTFC